MGNQATLRQIVVYMSDGDTITTMINGTDEEIAQHYLGHRFEAGCDTAHHIALLVHFCDTDRRWGLRVRNIGNGCVRTIKGVRQELNCDTGKPECIWLAVSDTEYSLDDVWVYDDSGNWINTIGYPHETA